MTHPNATAEDERAARDYASAQFPPGSTTLGPLDEKIAERGYLAGKLHERALQKREEHQGCGHPVATTQFCATCEITRLRSELQRAREAAIEEAACVAQEFVMSSGDHGTEIAAAIRALKETK